MAKLILSEVFPTKLSAAVFIAYMVLYVNQGVFVTASKEANSKYSYNTVTVVMMIELIKLFVSSSIFIKEFSLLKLFQDILIHVKVMMLYFVPAFLYSLYNNLTFINLSVFDPTTYYLLLQLRVVVTGVVFQVLFKKQLSRKQWISLLLLTVGCIVKQMHTKPSMPSEKDSEGNETSSHAAYFYFLLVLIQVFCSCFAGVYNEYLLKDTGAEVHLMIQNVFMYLDSIVCNIIFILIKGEGQTAFSVASLQSVFTPLVVAIMLNGAACGIVTSVFLKNLNSILKTFASAIELSFTAICCWIIFGIAIDIYTFISIAIVVYATFLYAQNPVVNKGRFDAVEKGEDAVKLMSKEDNV
ncbi:UDP-galactose transporter senju-like [Uloborus diversus]|uniref:UDP-galactose transporter senju-like n=1 Tax=Uloborus diversus TaxID=327109 RepID=UPI002409D78A|nr:UDP-galactose transporter senju-like [Uloborus diversus]